MKMRQLNVKLENVENNNNKIRIPLLKLHKKNVNLVVYLMDQFTFKIIFTLFYFIPQNVYTYFTLGKICAQKCLSYQYYRIKLQLLKITYKLNIHYFLKGLGKTGLLY